MSYIIKTQKNRSVGEIVFDFNHERDSSKRVNFRRNEKFLKLGFQICGAIFMLNGVAFRTYKLV